jgi:predicted peroxiredoxin
MKAIALFIFMGLFFASCNSQSHNDKDSDDGNHAVIKTETARDGVFIHITESYNDPHKVLMPLQMASLMAQDKDVLIYMDIHAVELLVKGAKDLNHAGFESCQTYLKELLDKNVGIYACPTCLKVAGFEPEDLMDGIQVAQKDKFFNFTKGRIITLDY